MLSAADGLGPGSQTRHAGTRAGRCADHAETPRHGQLLANADHDRRHRRMALAGPGALPDPRSPRPRDTSHRCDPLDRIHNRLARYRHWPGARDSVTEMAEETCRQLGDELAGMTWPTAIVHGDAHPGNVVVTATGRSRSTSTWLAPAPAMWDLTIPVEHHRRSAGQRTYCPSSSQPTAATRRRPQSAAVLAARAECRARARLHRRRGSRLALRQPDADPDRRRRADRQRRNHPAGLLPQSAGKPHSSLTTDSRCCRSHNGPNRNGEIGGSALMARQSGLNLRLSKPSGLPGSGHY